ncbi:MAG: efflux RND transporter permease subunit [Planctomycetota bacterium]|jgi:HAE1 family hydrophobic/amphiphilic exporter-1|nr:efflux RND transporter permease subunit [Planctomycetota bacterium]
MNIPRFAIERPIFVSMVTLMTVIIGGIALFRLPIDLLPDVSFPAITISTEYENASPEVVEELVTRPLEEALAAVPGAEEVTSNSAEGQSTVTVKFSWGTDLDAASADVRDRLDRVLGRLPDGAERPVLFKFDTASMPIVFIGVTGEMDSVELRRFLDDSVKFRIESIPGVASLSIFGGREREISVNVDPFRINAMGISMTRVLAVLKSSNINKPAGYVDAGIHEITIRAPGEFDSVEEIRNTVIATVNGAPVRIRDIADVEDGMRRVRRVARINGREGVRMAVTKQSGSNTVAIAGAVVEEIERIRQDYSHLNLVIIRNNADYINNSINNVSRSAMLGGGLAVVIILVFLRNFLATLVIAVSIPVSIVATFAILFMGGLTLNLMTLGGLALGVGMLVDNSIVVLENIYRIRDEEGLDPDACAEKGANEVLAAIIASTLTTLVVFLPLVFIEGMAGVMFKQFALVVTFSLACSLVAAVVIVPMLAAKIMRYQAGLRRGRLTTSVFNGSEQILRGMENEYRKAIAWCLDHRFLTSAVTILLVAGSGLLLARIDIEMSPKTDEGYANINIELDTGIQLARTEEKVKEIERIAMAEIPELKTILASVGGNWWSGVATHQASINLRFGTREERQALGQRSTEEIATFLRKRLEHLPGATVRVSEGSSWGRGGGESEPVAVEIRGYDLDAGAEYGRQVRELFRAIPGIVDARITREGGVPEELFRIDRQKAADLHLWVEDIATFLEICMAGKEAAQFRELGKEYPINVRLKDSEKLTIDELLTLTVMNGDGNMVSLRNVLTTEESQGPTIIERKNQQRVTTVKAALSGRALGSAMDEVREAVGAIPLSAGFSLEFGDDYQDQVDMMTDLIMGFALALILVYMVMACQFESLRDPFVIMFSVPLAAIGVFTMLFLTGTTINMQSMIGCIMLAGIVVNNAIILVDQANLLRRQDGFSVREALEEAGRRRLRPILMTALTTALGLVPMCFGWGDGGEAQAPMARAVVGGLMSSTFITLLVVPVIYSLLESGREAAGTTSKRLRAHAMEPAK